MTMKSDPMSFLLAKAVTTKVDLYGKDSKSPNTDFQPFSYWTRHALS